MEDHTSNMNNGRYRTLDTADSFECAWIDESKSEVVATVFSRNSSNVSGGSYEKQHPATMMPHPSTVSFGHRDPTSSPPLPVVVTPCPNHQDGGNESMSATTTTMEWKDDTPLALTAASSTSPIQRRRNVPNPSSGRTGRLVDARNDKTVKEYELRQKLRVITGARVGGTSVADSISLVDLDESYDSTSFRGSDVGGSSNRMINKESHWNDSFVLVDEEKVSTTAQGTDAVGSCYQMNGMKKEHGTKEENTEGAVINPSLSCCSFYEDDDTELTWRLHPSVSLSDWNVDVVVLATDKIQPPRSIITYPVHKSVMAVGPRRSNYFVQEFKNHALAVKKAKIDALKRAKKLEEEKRQNEAERHEEQQRKQRAASIAAHNAAVASNPFARLAAGCSLLANPLAFENDEKKYPTMRGRHPLPPEQPPTSRPTAPPSSPPGGRTSSPTSTTDRMGGNDKSVVTVPNVSRIELQELAADAFPYALDFLYSTRGFLDIRTESATALYFLSKKLEMKALQKLTERFWRNDLTIDTLLLYYHHGRLFADNDIIAAAEVLCAEHLFTLSDDAVVTFLTAIDAPFMYNVINIVYEKFVQTKKTNPEKNGSSDEPAEVDRTFYFKLSVLIAVYCYVHRGSLTSAMFSQLTDERHIPIVEAMAAKSLLETQESIVGPNSEVTSLTLRCVNVLSDHWGEKISTQFGRLSLQPPSLDNPPIGEERDDEISGNGTNRSVRNSRIAIPQGENGLDETTPNIRIEVPRVCGDAIEQFATLALQKAKREISQLESSNTIMRLHSEQMEREIKMLRQQQDLDQQDPFWSDSQQISMINSST